MNNDTLKVIYSLMSTYWKFIRKYSDMDSNKTPAEWDKFTEEGCVIGEMYKDNEAISRFNRKMILACIELIECASRDQIGEV